MFLIILGAMPPPKGGVSIHIQRLIPYLNESNIKYSVWDHSKIPKRGNNIISIRRHPLKILSIIINNKDTKVLHCPLSFVTLPRLLFFLFLKMVGIRITITLVGSPQQMIGDNLLKLKYLLLLEWLSSHLILNNSDFKKILNTNKTNKIKISIIPAFIPPKDDFSNHQHIPNDISQFCLSHKPLIVTYAYGPAFHKGQDLYGLDLIIDLADQLNKLYPSIGFLVVITEITNKHYFDNIMARIQRDKLQPFLKFVIGNQFSFVSFLKYADIFIRATNTDGDALTLREALYYGVVSIASDVCRRPHGSILFRNRDSKDLVMVVKAVLDRGIDNNQVTQKREGINNAHLFIDVFKKVAGLSA